MNQLVTTQDQLPSIYSMDENMAVAVLGESLYPGAKPQSIILVMDYCRAANLDPMQKPVHIVPMYDKASGGMRDVIMPGVNSYRVNAMRSGDYVGITEPEFGPMVDGACVGMAGFQFPEWCKVTVKRMLRGQIAEFTAIEYWMENYATTKKTEITPNATWKKRPRGQISKCAEAQALRKAFPEIASAPTHEEMEGKFDSAPAPAAKDMGKVEIVEPSISAEQLAEMLQWLESAADKGIDELGAAWKALSVDGRKTIGAAKLAELKDKAKPLFQKLKEAENLDALYALADIEREMTEQERASFEQRQKDLEG